MIIQDFAYQIHKDITATTTLWYFFHSIAHRSSSLHSLLPPLEILMNLLVFESPPNSPRIATRTKKYQSFVSYRIIRSFPLSTMDPVFTSITRLYTPSSIVTLISIVDVYRLQLSNHFNFYVSIAFVCACIYVASGLQYPIKSLSLSLSLSCHNSDYQFRKNLTYEPS